MHCKWEFFLFLSRMTENTIFELCTDEFRISDSQRLEF
jgi:hypothetical protein